MDAVKFIPDQNRPEDDLRHPGYDTSGRKVLLVDDEPEVLWGLIKFLEEEGYSVKIAENAREALEILPEFLPEIVFLDVKMPGMNGLDALEKIRALYPDIIPFILTAHESIKDAVQAIKSGAYDYFIKPYHTEEVKFSILRALEEKRLKEEVLILRKKVKERFDFSAIVTADPMMFDMFDKLRRVAPSDLSVLITGENGTGKELVAQAIHYNSSRKERPFIPLDCAAIPDSLFESAVFGYEKGAFTGSDGKKKGFFEMAHEGTLFLDEVGNLKPENQSKLLRAIQERKIFPLGGKGYINVDIRLISATNVDLDSAKEDGIFREDLYFRIKQFHVHLPPLRKRPNDILLLARHFLAEEAKEREMPDKVKELSSGVMDILMGYSWPGNVRELKNIIMSASVLAEDIILPEHLPFPLVSNMVSVYVKNPPKNIPHISSSDSFTRRDPAQTEMLNTEEGYRVAGYKKIRAIEKMNGSADQKINSAAQVYDNLDDLGERIYKHNMRGVDIDINPAPEWPELTIEPGMTFKDLHHNIDNCLERRLIIKALHEAEGNKAKAARIFGIDYKTLHSKIKGLQICKTDINPDMIPESIMDISLSGPACQFKDIIKKVREKMEESLILYSLRENKWDKAKAARSLGIDYKTLFNKLHKYNLMEKA